MQTTQTIRPDRSVAHAGGAPAWPLGAWYVAATSEELAQKPLSRQICGLWMVFFRPTSGGVAAMEDFCPHRGAPLSLGFVRDDTLVCGYHGLAVDCRGHADSMPGQRVKNFVPVRTFPVLERFGFIWVWPGDPEQATTDRLHHLPWADSDDWAYGGGLFHIQCDYRLMVDNLMDLTHETYVHSSSIGQKEIDEAPVNTRIEGSEVVVSRTMEKVQAPPFWRMAMQANGLPEHSLVDRWQICRFTLPSHVMIEVGVALEGQGGYDADLSKKVSSIVVDFITPETETSHWYFRGMARQFAVNDNSITAQIRKGQGEIFSEDLEMLQQQQRNLLKYPERRPMKVNIDAGGARSRLMIERAISHEMHATGQAEPSHTTTS